MKRAVAISLLLVALAGCGAEESTVAVDPASLPYAAEYPEVGYSTSEPHGALGQFARSVAAGDIELDYDDQRGYLDATLETLGIDASTQALVFSRTSLQTRHIGPATPRAIYFNDESYVAWVPGAPTLELASFDPELGPVFYTVLQEQNGARSTERKLGVCLRCHDSYSMTGGGVPRFLLGSGYIDTRGELVSHEAWILTSQATPLRSRWGGWYVTGRHGDQLHLGNIVVEQAGDLSDLESLRIGNVDSLDGLLDTSSYLTSRSDIVALMVLEHQVEVQNRISRLRYETVSGDGEPLDEHVESLVEAMLFLDEIDMTAPITGSSGFTDYFESLGPFDSDGRSLREFDLQTRLFRYPLSYQIYTQAFQSLPERARSAVYGRLRDVLAATPAADGLDRLSAADRAAIREILRATLPEALGI